jgi:predicted amino acid racemase
VLTAPRLEIDLAKIEANTRTLVQRLGRRGIRVTGVTKAAMGAPELGTALERGGVTGLADSRIQNLGRLRASGSTLPRTLLRSPMLTEVDAVVRDASISLNSEPTVIAALANAARRRKSVHGVILMVELGDLREGASPQAVVGLAEVVERHRFLELIGIGTNLACQSGVVPDDAKMDDLSGLAEKVEARLGRRLAIVSGGNSANLAWAQTATDVGRVNELRLGEAILLGTDPVQRTTIVGLHTDACRLIAEVIEVQAKPAQPWGTIGQAAFGVAAARPGSGTRRQALLAIGRQDIDPDGLTPPAGLRVLGASSDHLVVDVASQPVAVGDRLTFGLDYSALVRASTSPFVAKDFHRGQT